jgi:hypothetical protein
MIDLLVPFMFIVPPLYAMVLRGENKKLRKQVRQLTRTPKIPSWVNGG